MLKSEEQILSEADPTESLLRNRNSPPRAKRRKSRLLIDATPKPGKPPLPLPPQLPPKPVANEFWEWIQKHTHYIPEQTQKYLSDVANQTLNKDLFDRQCVRKSKRARSKDSKTQILSSKLNRAIEVKPTPDVKPDVKTEKIRFDEQSVKERLIQAGVYIDDDNELLIELVQAQDEVRELANRNRLMAQLLQKVAKNHDKIIKNREKLFELDKDLTVAITENKYNTEDFLQKLKQRQKYVKTIDKMQTTNRMLSNSTS